MIVLAVAGWEKEREGVTEVRRRAWAEDAAMQGSLASYALPGLSSNQSTISRHSGQWEDSTKFLAIIVMRGRA